VVPPSNKQFNLVARVSSANLSAVRPALEEVAPKSSVRSEGEELVVEGEMFGASAKELNRLLLSSLRRAEKRTRLRAEWTSVDGIRERYFDYVLKKTSKVQRGRT
jgi:hypothetical protein